MNENTSTTEESNTSSSYSNNSSLTAVSVDHVIEQNKQMFSALTSAMESAISGMGNQVHLSVNKLTDAVTHLTTQHAKNLVRDDHSPESSDNGEDLEGEGYNDTIHLHAEDRTLYEESPSAESFYKKAKS